MDRGKWPCRRGPDLGLVTWPVCSIWASRAAGAWGGAVGCLRWAWRSALERTPLLPGVPAGPSWEAPGGGSSPLGLALPLCSRGPAPAASPSPLARVPSRLSLAQTSRSQKRVLKGT